MNATEESARVYRFDPFEVDIPAHEIRRRGVRVRVQDQPFQVLKVLLDRAGQVVTREELRQRVWPSSVFVDFDHGLNNAVARLRELLGDTPAEPQFIETIPRIGYRFRAKVAIVTPEAEATAHAAEWHGRWLLPLGAIAAGLLVAWILYLWPGDSPNESTDAARTPSIAVLPFVALDQDPENEQFADGLTEELVTRLAGIRGLRVVARTSSFRFKGKSGPAKEIAEALQVNHLLEGSVRRSGGRLRITAQLIDARSDEHVWSQTFDRKSGDIFVIQEEIALAVADAMKISLLASDEQRIRRHGTSDAEAYRLYLIAQSHLLQRTSNPDLGVAKRSFEGAIAKDPTFAAAHAGLARYHFRRAWGSLVDTEDSSQLGMAAAQRAVALDPKSSDARMAHANFEFWRHRFRGDYGAHVAAESDMQRAIALDPTNSVAYEDYGRAIIWHAPDRASNLLERAIQLDLLCTGPNIMIASLLGISGRLEAARKRCADLLAQNPEARVCDMAIGTLETYYGNFDAAVPLLQASEKYVGGAARIQLWSIHMSAGDRKGATSWLDFGRLPMEKPLSDAARHAMTGRYDLAYAILDDRRGDFPQSRLLDLPAAKFALLAGRPGRAREILEARLPDLASGIEPVSARNLMPAIDLATAWTATGLREQARELLGRAALYLDGPGAPGLPMFAVQRARVHALADEDDAAMRALERAFAQGQRAIWALDLRPQSFLYVDPLEADPAFASLRKAGRIQPWIERVQVDNAKALEQFGSRQPVQTAVRLP